MRLASLMLAASSAVFGPRSPALTPSRIWVSWAFARWNSSPPMALYPIGCSDSCVLPLTSLFGSFQVESFLISFWYFSQVRACSCFVVPYEPSDFAGLPSGLVFTFGAFLLGPAVLPISCCFALLALDFEEPEAAACCFFFAAQGVTVGARPSGSASAVGLWT